MSQTSRNKRRTRRKAARSNTKQEYITLIVIGGIALVLIILAIHLYLPNVALIMRGGGASRAKNIVPRNTDVWIVNADGTLRFATLFFPVREENTPTGEIYTVTGPLLDQATDVLNAKTFGALSANSEVLPGTGRGSDRVYEQYWIERDPESEVYGLEVLAVNYNS